MQLLQYAAFHLVKIDCPYCVPLRSYLHTRKVDFKTTAPGKMMPQVGCSYCSRKKIITSYRGGGLHYSVDQSF